MNETIKKIFETGKGILAADESTKTITKRFGMLGVEANQKNISEYRNILFKTNNLNQCISGVILYKDTLEQQLVDSKKVPNFLKENNIIAGVKVDEGTEKFSENGVELYTKGLDGLKERCNGYYEAGARFSKWRNVFSVEENLFPTDALIDKNTSDLAKYAKISQESGLVPIIEPEILRDGNHSIVETKKVFCEVFKTLFKKLESEQVELDSLILKTSFVVSGSELPYDDAENVANETVDIFEKFIPKNIGGIVFLSGGLSPSQSVSYLSSTVKKAKANNFTTPISFSYSRAVQNNAMVVWSKNQTNEEKVQEIFFADTEKASKALDQ